MKFNGMIQLRRDGKKRTMFLIDLDTCNLHPIEVQNRSHVRVALCARQGNVGASIRNGYLDRTVYLCCYDPQKSHN